MDFSKARVADSHIALFSSSNQHPSKITAERCCEVMVIVLELKWRRRQILLQHIKWGSSSRATVVTPQASVAAAAIAVSLRHTTNLYVTLIAAAVIVVLLVLAVATNAINSIVVVVVVFIIAILSKAWYISRVLPSIVFLFDLSLWRQLKAGWVREKRLVRAIVEIIKCFPFHYSLSLPLLTYFQVGV